MANQLGVAEKCRGAMMIGVEKGKRLLLEHEEDCVKEFEVFGEVVELFVLSVLVPSVRRRLSQVMKTYVVEHNKLIRPTTLIAADRGEQAPSRQCWHKLFHKQQQ